MNKQTKAFNECNFSIEGIKKLFVITKDRHNNPINFPVDRNYMVGTDDMVEIYVGYEGGINEEDEYRYYEINPKYAKFEDEFKETRQGVLYYKTLEFTFPDISDKQNNEIIDAFFDDSGFFALSQIIILYIDKNDNHWISGYDMPFTLEEFDLQTDMKNGDNSYYFKYVQSNYMPKKNFKLIYGKL